MVNIGVIGYGYWGPNILRNFNSTEGAKVKTVCDTNPEVLKRVSKNFPGIALMDDWEALTRSADIDAVAIVTPVSTHFNIAKTALKNGKHVFVEKPFTASVEQAEELVELAAKKKLTIMVDHTFLFTGAVTKIKQLVDADALGRIFYYDSTRVNLGIVQNDVNVIWDLAPHDFSIMRHLIKEKPVGVVACGQNHLNDHEDIAYIMVYFQSNLIAHFNVNWLSPVKVRNTYIGGTKKMLVWNDVVADDKIKIYDKGIDVDVKHKSDLHHLRMSYRSGDMSAPRLNGGEALANECAHFVDCLEHKKVPINSGRQGLEIVQLLAASDISLKEKGKFVKL